MPKHISSFQNPTVKRLLVLQEKSRARKKEGGFLIEGRREIELAVAEGYDITEIYIQEALITKQEVQAIVGGVDIQVTSLSADVYQKVAYRAGTEGVIAFAKAKPHTLDQLLLPKNPLLLVAEAPEKPGNIGAILRTADAAGVDGVIIANPRTDLYNPNIIRSSVGCVFTTTIATGSTTEIIDYLKEKGISIYSAILQEAVNYDGENYKNATALVVGTEATGLSPAWRTAGTNIKIPMRGTIDSMNVSVAAGVLVFEAVRQRNA